MNTVYTLSDIAMSLPAGMMYNVILKVIGDGEEIEHRFIDMGWSEMESLFNKTWWNENTRLVNMGVSYTGNMVLYLVKLKEGRTNNGTSKTTA